MQPEIKPKTYPELLIAFGVILIAGLVWYIYFKVQFAEEKMYPFSDTYDYCQMARELYYKNGFTSKYTHPAALRSYKVKDKFYNLWRQPLYPLLLSWAFLVSGNLTITVASYLNGLIFIATAVLIYQFSKVIFNNIHSALLSVFIYVTSLSALDNSVWGLSETLFIFLITLSLFFVYLTASRHSRRLIYFYVTLAGIFTGLAWLTRLETVIFLPSILFYGFGNTKTTSNLTNNNCVLKRKRASLALIFLIIVFLIQAPWWRRNYLITGNPFYTVNKELFATFTPEYPSWIRFRAVEVSESVRDYIFRAPDIIFWKTLKCSILNLIYILSLHWPLSPFLIILIAGLRFSHTSLESDRRKLETFLLTSIGLFILGISFFSSEARFFLVFLPLITIVVSEEIVGLISFVRKSVKRARPRYLLIAGLLVWFLTPYLAAIEDGIHRFLKKERVCGSIDSLENYEYLRNNTHLETVFISDVAAKLAWYTDRKSIWLPIFADLPKIEKMHCKVDALYLSPAVHALRVDEDVLLWRDIFNKRIQHIAGFKLEKVFLDGCLLYLKEKETK